MADVTHIDFDICPEFTKCAAIQSSGCEVTLQKRQRSGQIELDICVRHTDERRFHTALRIGYTSDVDIFLVSAFGVDVAEAALPLDIQPQEHANTVTETVLVQLFENRNEIAERLIEQLRRDWEATRKRLEDRWAELDKRSVHSDRLSAIVSTTRNYVGIAYRTTSPGQDEVFGVYRSGQAYSQIRHGSKIGVLNHEQLSKVSDLTSEEKIQILCPPGGQEFERAWDEFDRRRLRSSAFPIKLKDAVASKSVIESGSFYTIKFANGDQGAVFSDLDRNTFSADFWLADKKADIKLRLERDGSTFIGRSKVHEKRFMSVALLDQLLCKVLQMILALDPDVSIPKVEMSRERNDRHHPVLSALDIPDHQRELVDLFLGEPYSNAVQLAERWAARRAQKEANAEAMADAAKELPDGSILGKIDRRKWDDPVAFFFVNTKLGQVRSISKSTKRRRKIHPVYGFKNARPLTPRELVRLRPLKKLDALQQVHDVLLLEEARDLVEAAYRLSFSLEPGASNPLLEGETEIEYMAATATRPCLRITRMHGNGYCQAIAISVFISPKDWTEIYCPQTGAAFLSETINGECRFYTRPAIDLQAINTPFEHQSAIRFGIGITHKDPMLAAKATQAFAQQWEALGKLASKSN